MTPTRTAATTQPSTGATEPARSLRDLVPRLGALEHATISCLVGTDLQRRSFAELHRDVLRVQERLAAWGLGQGDRVGLLGPNSYDWVVHDLALVGAGCVTVALPPDLAGQDREDLAQRFGLHLLLDAGHDPEVAPGWCVPLALEAPGLDEGGVQARPAPHGDLPEEVFTLAFSSGTTGAVKCIRMSAPATEMILAEFRQHYDFSSDDAILVCLPLSTFQQRQMLYCAIWYGFDVIVADPSPVMFAVMGQLRPTIVGGPPAFYEFVERRFQALAPWRRAALRAASGAIRRALPPGLRQAALRRVFRQAHDAYGGRVRLLLSGSAPLRRSTEATFATMGLPLYQLYGLTESGFIAWNRPGRKRAGTVGRPVFEGSVRIAGDGEILVRWPRPQSLGYLDEPGEVERATYRPDGWIATGDLGSLDRDGFLTITGRKKDVIITRGGHKISPAEIERQVLAHPDIAHAVVLGGGTLDHVAVVVSLPEGAGDTATAAIERHVQRVNEGLVEAGRIQRVVFTRVVFDRASGLLTSSLKLDRDEVARRFEDALLQGRAWGP